MVRPLWQHELCNAVTSPHMLCPSFPASFKKSVVSSLNDLAPGENVVWPLREWTGPKTESFDDQGRKIPFTGNQIFVVKNTNKVLDSFATERYRPPPFVWVVIDTQQNSIHPPPLMFQPDGRAVMRQLRRRMIAVLVDKSGKVMHGPFEKVIPPVFPPPPCGPPQCLLFCCPAELSGCLSKTS